MHLSLTWVNSTRHCIQAAPRDLGIALTQFVALHAEGHFCVAWKLGEPARNAKGTGLYANCTYAFPLISARDGTCKALSCCTPCLQPQAKEFSQSLIGAGGKHGKANIVEITYGKTEEEISQGDEDYAACKYLCMRTNVRRYTLYRVFS